MKIRSGFVSNSSSSSFIFVFKNNIGYEENLKIAKEEWIDNFGDDDLDDFKNYIQYIDDNHSFIIDDIEYHVDESIESVFSRLGIKMISLDS